VTRDRTSYHNDSKGRGVRMRAPLVGSTPIRAPALKVLLLSAAYVHTGTALWFFDRRRCLMPRLINRTVWFAFGRVVGLPTMFSRALSALFSLLSIVILVSSRCHSQPGDPSFPSKTEWNNLNSTIDGRLLAVLPSAEVCEVLQCTDAQWASSVFRSTIPGQMNEVGLSPHLFGK
jgi:hypothetical protein